MFERETVIIRNGEMLSFDYVPKDLPGREKELSRLESIFGSVVNYGRSETAYVHGFVGTGKTCTVKRFNDMMADYCYKNNIGFGCIHINCRVHNTDTMVMTQCMHYFDPSYPDKGIKPEVMVRDFRAQVARSKKRIVIVLDEVNWLLRSNESDIVYKLSRMGEVDEGLPVSVSLILISQEYGLNRMDTATLSTFKSVNSIEFRKYSRTALREIVASRVNECMVAGTVSEEAIDAIADAAADDGDARKAITILDDAAKCAERRPKSVITAEDVRSVCENVFSVVNRDKLSDLGRNELFALLAFARANRTRADVTIAEAEKTYAIVCEEYGQSARKHTQFVEYANTLANSGLLVNRGTDSGRTKVFSIPEIPAKEMCKMIESIIEGNLR